MRKAVVALSCLAMLGFGQQAHATTASISILDTKFVPKHLTISMGDFVSWTNNGTVNHQIRSNASAPDSFEYLVHPGDTSSPTAYFGSVGTWPYHDFLHPKLNGTVGVKMEVDNTSRPLTQPFTLTWSPSSGAPYSYDVQVKDPGSSRFVTLFRDVTERSGTFMPPRRGTYKLRGRTKRVDTHTATGFSPAITITVT